MGIGKIIGRACDKMADMPVIGGIIKPKEKVAVIRMSGVITDAQTRKPTISHNRYADILNEAFDVYNLKAVALVLNCPGGSPAQSALIGAHIRRLAEEKEIPVYAFAEDVAASGGYWLACAADKIYAQDVSIVGSIGVISASFGFQDFIERYGVERRVHTSGKDKGFLDPFQSEKADDVLRLKDIQKDIHERFISWVKERRGERLNEDNEPLFEGGFWTGGRAQTLGLIDGIGDVYSVMRKEYGEDIKFKDFEPSSGFIAGLLGADTSVGEKLVEGLEAKGQWQRYGL